MNSDETVALKELYHILINGNDPKTTPYLHVLGKLIGQDSEFITLKSLLASDAWPEAIEKNLICDTDSEVDKISRAEGILELLVEKDLKDKKFLDLGCGEGHVVYKSLSQNPLFSIGYDIQNFPNWEKFGNSPKLLFTTNLEIVQQHSPYDVILIYDVIDHIEKEKAIEILTMAGKLLTKDGTIYLRTHPFCSRHATHLYHLINKAFVHLVFTAQELQDLGYDNSLYHSRITYPIKEYETLFKSANLSISHNNILREKVEPFFKKTPILKERIRMHYKDSEDKTIRNGGFPEFQCEQQFLDYVLKKEKQ